MHMVLTCMAILSLSLWAQEFTVEKVSGDVKVLRGTSEKWQQVKPGETLLGSDLVQTGESAFIQLSGTNGVFMLNGDAALGLSYIREVSLNELLLALAMEEIRNVPLQNGNDKSKTTAVYGEDKSIEETKTVMHSELGRKKLNGARYLAETGFEESALIAVAEIYRKYPDTKQLIEDRIYFADILIKLELYNEAFREMLDIKKYADGSGLLPGIEKRIEMCKAKLIK